MSQVFFDAEKHGNARNRFDAGDMVCVRLAQVLRVIHALGGEIQIRGWPEARV